MAREDYDGGFRSDGLGAAATDPVSVSSQVAQSQPLRAVASTIGQEGADGTIADILTKQEFFDQNNITLANPYGASLFGVDPSGIDYSGNLSEQQRRDIMDLAYDRYRNPFAEYNIFGDKVGGNPETGEVRYGLASLGSSPTTFLGDVVSVPVPKSASRSLAEMAPAGLGFLIRMLPQETRKMIEAGSLPGGTPTAADGRAEYEASKSKKPPTLGQFLQSMYNPTLK